MSDDLVRKVVEAIHRPARREGVASEVQARPARTEPTEDEIRERAYLLHLARGGAPGDPQADWIQAERELREAYARRR